MKPRRSDICFEIATFLSFALNIFHSFVCVLFRWLPHVQMKEVKCRSVCRESPGVAQSEWFLLVSASVKREGPVYQHPNNAIAMNFNCLLIILYHYLFLNEIILNILNLPTEILSSQRFCCYAFYLREVHNVAKVWWCNSGHGFVHRT